MFRVVLYTSWKLPYQQYLKLVPAQDLYRTFYFNYVIPDTKIFTSIKFLIGFNLNIKGDFSKYLSTIVFEIQFILST